MILRALSSVRIRQALLAFFLLPPASCLLLLPPAASATWARQESGTLSWLHAIYFLEDEQHGWAAGGSGALLVTTDGGTHWRVQRKPTADALRDVLFLNEQTGWLVCERSIYELQTKEEPRAYLLHTTDGGATWRRIEATGKDIDTLIVRIIFADAEHGWTFGEEGALYATTDGGETWTRQRIPTRHLLLGGTFADTSAGWIVGAGATLLYTNDGGTEWRGVSLPVEPAARLQAVAFADARHGWAVGARGLVLTTANGGRSWTTQTSNSAADLFDVKFLDAQEGWSAGTDGTLLHTTDGGSHWRLESAPARHPLERLCFVSRTRGWAVGFGGTIIAYTNAPATPPVMKSSTGRP